MKEKNREQRARLHAALGDETRLAIVDDLIASDRAPTALATRLGIPTNLLAHHLDVLERAGAIQRLKSTGDARRRYVSLTSASVELLGRAHAAPRGRVLFLCTRNSARSQLAAAVWRARTGRMAESAGTRPADNVSIGAADAARRAGLSLEGARPRAFATVERGTQVITVCDLVHEELDGHQDWWHWSIPAPSGRSAAFDAVIDELNERITRLGYPQEVETKRKVILS